MRLIVSEVAKLSGVSVRTLHYYDEIGLLPPSLVNEKGYRYYEDGDIERLQEILFFRELDFSLKEIARILSRPDYDRREALERQKHLLALRRDRISDLIALLDANLRGEKRMSFKEFDMKDIEQAKSEYGREAMERWGSTDSYAESAKKTARYGAADWERITAQSNELTTQFAALVGTNPQSREAQDLVRAWQQYISENFYTCTDQMLAGLAEMYVADERFRKSIDKAGEGSAAFMRDAIRHYCEAKRV